MLAFKLKHTRMSSILLLLFREQHQNRWKIMPAFCCFSCIQKVELQHAIIKTHKHCDINKEINADILSYVLVAKRLYIFIKLFLHLWFLRFSCIFV